MNEIQDLSSLIGREVYTTDGVYVGQVDDVRLDFDGGSATELAMSPVNRELLGHLMRQKRGVTIPYRWVRAVGDVVLVTSSIEHVASPENEMASEVTA